jgi:hypothetical protein
LFKPWQVLLFLLLALLLSATALNAQTTYSDIDQMSGWKACSGCAKGAGIALYSQTPNQTSPVLQGHSTKFWIGGNVGYSDALFYRKMSTNGTANHFIYEVYYYYKNPGSAAGMEFSAAQHRPGVWYRWDWQCAYTVGLWRTWDNAGGKWVNTSVPCVRPQAYKWQHVVLEGQRISGKTVFISFTVDGVKHYVNRTFSPKPVTTTTSWVTFHFQLNGGKYQTDYSVWGDKFKLTYW